MNVIRGSLTIIFSASLISVMGLVSPQNLHADSNRNDHRNSDKNDHRNSDRNDHRGSDRNTYRKPDRHPQIIHRGHGYRIPANRIRSYRNRHIVRPYGSWYSGYGHYNHDNDAFKWLAFTVITLAILDNLNESEQRAHEDAQIRATSAPIGESIIWRDNRASGSVTATREGTSTSGRYCREFQQEVNVGGRSEQAYGTACRQADGTWEVISTGSQ